MNETKLHESEGWMAERPPTEKRHHYIRNTMSLCGRYGFYAGELEPHEAGAAKRKTDCAACFKKLEREAKR